MKNYLKEQIKKGLDEAQRIKEENEEKDRKFEEHSKEIQQRIREQDKYFSEW